MKATVAGINLNAQANGKNYVEFITQADPYNGQVKPPRTHRLYPPYANELIEVVKTLKVGDRVEYQCDNTQYKNMNQLNKITAEEAAPKKAGGWKQDEETTKRIARAAAMKEATQIVLFGAKKTTQVDELIDEVITATQTLEKFLMFEDHNVYDTEAPDGKIPDDEIPF